ncbi:MAG: GAF and ANTAR domain-containing protein [Microbacteriaceae bacterium]
MKLITAFVKLADALIARYDMDDLLHTLLLETTQLLDVEAGALLLDSGGTLQLAASTSEHANFVEMMRLGAGSGPCVECFTTGRAVAVADIEELGGGWAQFRSAAVQNGFRSLYAIPLRLRGATIGALNLFSTHVAMLNPQNAALAQALADVATIGILHERSIRETSRITEQLQRALNSRVLIEQAKGVLAATASIDMDEAFTALRNHARNNNLSLHAVAASVVNGTLDIDITLPATGRDAIA